ncbi:MAG: TIGR00730 family Rossman fold protein [Tannerellaceae bacterium]|jgi:uncharacterized protein (TIGR00730 family)|nr:TIGR00730 family Rossman fold protein [Tannerellaceae bacterium]
MTAILKKIAVYCGSNAGVREEYAQQAYLLGMVLAMQGIDIICGGGKVGLMKCVADGALDNGGRVIGVIPGFLNRTELAHEGLSQMIVVNTMHERKYRMSVMAQAFIALPGGYGTLDELFEIITWAQLGLHTKPVGILNTEGFYNSLLSFLDNMSAQAFLKPEHREMLLAADNVPDLLDQLRAYQPIATGKWI